ncbi:hypothetical protein C5167_041782 [Papaver somniferum]|nr:hypothetical protein C5167_041782 [Papaver somniferum]
MKEEEEEEKKKRSLFAFLRTRRNKTKMGVGLKRDIVWECGGDSKNPFQLNQKHFDISSQLLVQDFAWCLFHFECDRSAWTCNDEQSVSSGF